MPNLSIKNVPEELLEKLRQRATRNHRSMQGELIALLHAAVESAPEGPERLESPSIRRSGTRRIEEIAADHRQRWVKPFSRGPRAVDLVCSERDAR